NCSIASRNQMANGSEAKTPVQPNGRKGPPPSGKATAAPSGPMPMLRASLLKSKADNAARKKNTRIAIARKVMKIVNLNESSTPQMLRPKKMTKTPTHQTHCHSGGVPYIVYNSATTETMI